MIGSEIAESNENLAFRGFSAFMPDLARAVSNSGDIESGAAWLCNFVRNFLCSRRQSYGQWAGFVFAASDLGKIDQIWPAFRFAAANCPDPGAAQEMLSHAARYLIERLPHIWAAGDLAPAEFLEKPVTRAVWLADRIDTITAFFSVGIKPSGSKDPFALRRATKEILQCILAPRIPRDQRPLLWRAP